MYSRFVLEGKSKFFGPLSFYKTVLRIAIPVMGQLLIQTLVSLVDNFMVAGLGDVKMSGVNVSNQLVFVLLVALMALATAGGMFMAQYSGAKDEKGMQQVFRFKVLTMCFLAGISVFLIFLIPERLMSLMVLGNKNEMEIIVEGKNYLLIVSFAFLPLAVSGAISTSLREIGNVKPPLYISAVASVVNVIGNYILIYGHFGMPRLEVMGAACATVLARSVEVICFIVYAKKRNVAFFVSLFHLFFVKWKLFFEIFKKSTWMFISEVSWVVSETIINAVYNQRGGTEVVAGMSAGWTISELFFLTFNGIGISVAVIVGGLLGQNKLEEARLRAKWLRSGSVIVGITNGVIQALSVFIFIPLFFGRLSIDAQIVAKHLLWVVALYMPIWTYQYSQYATLRAGGDTFTTAWVDASVNVFLFVPSIFVLRDFTSFGPVLMYGMVKISSLLKPLMCGVVIKKEKWLNNLTVLDK